MIAHTTDFVTLVVEHWLEREMYRLKSRKYFVEYHIAI